MSREGTVTGQGSATDTESRCWTTSLTEGSNRPLTHDFRVLSGLSLHTYAGLRTFLNIRICRAERVFHHICGGRTTRVTRSLAAQSCRSPGPRRLGPSARWMAF